MKSVTFSQVLATVSICMLSSLFHVNAKEYYKWVDAHGVTTYSATPPPAKKQEPQLDPAQKKINAVAPPPISVIPPQSNNEVKTNLTTVKSTVNAPAKNTTVSTKIEVNIPLKSCNGVRCWDTKGKHYNLVQGNTYLSATGGKCQKTGNNMHCSK